MRGYAPHDGYIAPARRDPALFKIVIAFFAVEFLFTLGITALDYLLMQVAPGAALAMWDGSTPVALSLQLLSFGIMAGAVILVARAFYQRGAASLFGPVRIAARDLLRVFVAAGLVFLAVELLPPWYGFEPSTEFRPLLGWIAALPLGMAALLVQTGSEEVFYRGLLQQQVAARFSHPIAWLILPNAIFALAHYENGIDPTDAAQYVIWAFAFGVAASDLTARTGSLGAAIGFHLANNAYSFLFFGEQGAPDSGLAYVLLPAWVPEDGLVGPVFSITLLIELAIVGLCWLAARLALRR
ncbi:CPBP family intramembrane glutamic endopeptidase [Pseudooceanicola nanhaiensis]|uniref:CPBP family intramembrane glutamic endopeptidase n=1 Tax=Pseudooceanicola nanhaiensis TaxID=375761 RepID=UPI001CD28858|nr:type II CAAX endopeptidase family protein [Pseudooceanicola nanhaiensis]MCA0921786.1 CPBP family intramembrane metalloprotease [Pseudooceanicola nanhaiensis]